MTKVTRYLCLGCDTLHDSEEEAALCCPNIEEVEVCKDRDCANREDCTEGCFDRWPQFPRGHLTALEYVKEYEKLNHLKETA